MSTEMFIPSEKQIELLRVMVDGTGKPTITAFCEEAGINRDTYYNWFDNPEFVGWFNREWEVAMAKKITWLDRIGLQKSPTDFRYWEALQMKYGKFSRRNDITTDNQPITAVKVEFINGSKDESDQCVAENTGSTEKI